MPETCCGTFAAGAAGAAFGVLLLVLHSGVLCGGADDTAAALHVLAGAVQELRGDVARARSAPTDGDALQGTAVGASLHAARTELQHLAAERATRTGKRPPPLWRTPRWRWELGGILNSEGKRHGAEIGVQQAKFSAQILRHWHACTKYILIDVWEPQENYVDDANKDKKVQDWLFDQAMQRVSPWKDRVAVLRNWSHHASAAVPDGSLDFVYIDARHDYESVLEDLRDWWPKCRRGCLFAGHDFTSAKTVKGFRTQRDGSINMRAVRGAVEQFSAEVGRPYLVIPDTKNPGRKAPFASWVMRK
eukprot:TRINITY_DN3628_c0_g2_i1.p1 TRINITY_DN3628_c0_g2~~TRINITY_DN3628_c0_g2_i1.p1  ORF type:complete len:304 (+),score=93.49 TRINITY_DN3628_c0_g2_i1:106-1017(+)